MIFLILTVSFNLLSTGNLQELNDANNFKLPQKNLAGPFPVLGDQWPVQTIQTVQGNFFGQAFRNINEKPCSSRRNLQDLDEQWVPTYTSRIIKPVDTSNLNAQPIKEENNDIKNVPDATPAVIKDNVPIAVLDDGVNNFLKSRNPSLFDDLTENRFEDPIGMQHKLTSEGRSQMENTGFNDDALSLINQENQEDNKLLETPGHIELKGDIEELEPAIGGTVNTFNIPEECINKKNMEGSRRSMSNFEKQDNSVEMNDKTDNKLNKNLSYSENNPEKPLVNDKNVLTGTEGNKNGINMRKAVPTKFLANGKPSQDPKIELRDPTQGPGVSELSESRMMLMDYSRLCYACSSASNPTCWTPDRKTTVKYCRKGHEACVTKTFQTANTLTLVRDCGKTCEDVDIPGFVPKYKSCSICHSDLCNSGYTIKSHNVIFAFLLITVIKCIY